MTKSYKCEKLESTLHFLPDKIKFCCSNAAGVGMDIKNYNKTDKTELIKTKNYYIGLLAKGIIPNECRGCIHYKETDDKSKNSFWKFFKKNKNILINHIIIDHYKECDCNCIYCSQKIIYKDSKQKYQLLPLIKDLYRKNIIDKKNLKVEFQGGNVSMLKEFDALLNEFKNNNCKLFIILMNGIEYLPALETIKENEGSTAVISLDSGTKETFFKIKNVDAFDRTVENIRKIREKTSFGISLKYIIIKGINDNLQEVKAFLNIAKDLNLNSNIVFDIDYRDTMMNNQNEFKVPQHYYDIINYAKEFCLKNNLCLFIPEYSEKVLAQGTNFFKS